MSTVNVIKLSHYFDSEFEFITELSFKYKKGGWETPIHSPFTFRSCAFCFFNYFDSNYFDYFFKTE